MSVDSETVAGAAIIAFMLTLVFVGAHFMVVELTEQPRINQEETVTNGAIQNVKIADGSLWVTYATAPGADARHAIIMVRGPDGTAYPNQPVAAVTLEQRITDDPGFGTASLDEGAYTIFISGPEMQGRAVAHVTYVNTVPAPKLWMYVAMFVTFLVVITGTIAGVPQEVDG